MNRKNDYADMDLFRETRKRQKRRYYGRTTNAVNRRQPWTVHDLERVLAHDITDTQLAAEIGRSVRAIQMVRSKQNARAYSGA